MRSWFYEKHLQRTVNIPSRTEVMVGSDPGKLGRNGSVVEMKPQLEHFFGFQ